jgi:Tol biopolymer transport system component
MNAVLHFQLRQDNETDLNGTNFRQLTPGNQEQYFRCTPDGVWLLYFDFAEGSVKKILRAGGIPEILIPGSLRPDNQFDVTRDSKSLIAALHSSGETMLVSVSIAGGQLTRKFPLRPESNYITVTPDGKSIAYAATDHGVMNLWVQSLSDGPALQLSRFVQGPGPGKSLRNFAWSPDRKQLALVRVTASYDVVLLQDQSK